MNTDETKKQPLITIGKFGKTHGLDGKIRVFSYCKPLENIFSYNPWHTEFGKVTCEKHISTKAGFIVNIENIDDIDKAETLVNTWIKIENNQRPQTEENEYYWSDLEGLDVVEQDGKQFGKVKYLIEGAGEDIMLVENHDGKQNLIPFEKNTVIDVNIADKKIIVDWIEADDIE